MCNHQETGDTKATKPRKYILDLLMPKCLTEGEDVKCHKAKITSQVYYPLITSPNNSLGSI